MMYKFVYLLVFASVSIANCEYAKNITMDIKLVDNGKKVECSSQSTGNRLIEGEQIRLIANIPYDIQYMWCEVKENFRTADGCNQTTNQCITITRFNKSQQGTWGCSYLMQPNETFRVNPITTHNEKNYTIALCKLSFEAVESLWFTGLDPNRRTMNKLLNGSGSNFTYRLEENENLNIGCMADNKVDIKEFVFHDACKNNNKNLTGQLFQRNVDDLDGSTLICYSKSKSYGTNYTISLDLHVNQKVWLTGLDPSRTDIKRMLDCSGLKYTYKYQDGERLNIVCEANDEVEIIKFYYLDAQKNHHVLLGKRFEKTGDYALQYTKLICLYKMKQSGKEFKLQLMLESSTQVPPGYSPPIQPSNPVNVAAPTTRNIPSTTTLRTTTKTIRSISKTPTPKAPTTKSPISAQIPPEPTNLEIVDNVGKELEHSKNKNTKTYEYKFNKPQNKTIQCRINKPDYNLTLWEENNVVANIVTGKNRTVSSIFILEDRNKTVYCIANATETNRIFQNTVYMVYDGDEGTTVTEPTAATERGMANQSDKDTGDPSQSFLDANWPFILMGCAIVITICVVACCLKFLCSKKEAQPPENYTSFTNDRGIDSPTMPAPNRTMPKINSNYCDPKDIQGRKNNVEPNYSEAREPGSQGMGEGLYAELNRPENTYAEPYINKTELYARPIPKAERPKKDDPNYGNVFGQDYVNSRK